MPRRALVTGATGFVGSHLADLLLQRGWSVRCTVRKSSNLQWLEGRPLDRVEADLRGAAGLRAACRGVDAVFHVAGVIRAPSYEGFRAGNVEASANLADAAVAEGVKRFLHVSSLAAAGPSADGKPVDESTPPNPVSNYGRSKREGEQAVSARGAKIDVTIVRPPVVYGTRDQGLLEMYRALKYGIVPVIGGPKHVSIVHVGDLCAGILAAAESDAAAGGVYFLSNEEPMEMTSGMELMCAALGRRKVRHVHLTDGFVRLLGRIAESLPFGDMFSRDKAVEMTQRYWVCSPAKARRELGFRETVPLEKGMRETIAWFRDRGMV